MKSASLPSAMLLAMMCAGCTTSGSGGIILAPLPYKLLDETKNLKASHPSPIVWPRELAKNVTGPAVAEPGDLLSVSAVDPAVRVPFVGEQPILLDGTIDLAKYGRVVVGYKTLAEVEAIINATVKAGGGKDLTVTVRFARAPESKRVYVLGDVVTPGSYPINGNETVLDAILLAGGLTRKADERNIILSRPTAVCDCRVVVPVCHEEIVQWGDTSTNYQLLPGDRIYVPSLSLFHRIFGIRGPRCAPCNGCPNPCPLPAERCDNGCCNRPAGIATGPVEVGTPAATPGSSPSNAPKLDDRRLPPPQTLRDTPRDATALPAMRRFPAGPEFDPIDKPAPARTTTTLVDPTFKTMSAPSVTTAPKTTSVGAAAPTRDPKDASPTTDWQSPWRPASTRTMP